MFNSRKHTEDDEAKLAWMVKCVEETLADREDAVGKREFAVAAKIARLNENMHFVLAALKDAGHDNVAKVIARKVSEEWADDK